MSSFILGTFIVNHQMHDYCCKFQQIKSYTQEQLVCVKEISRVSLVVCAAAINMSGSDVIVLEFLYDEMLRSLNYRAILGTAASPRNGKLNCKKDLG